MVSDLSVPLIMALAAVRYYYYYYLLITPKQPNRHTHIR